MNFLEKISNFFKGIAEAWTKFTKAAKLSYEPIDLERGREQFFTIAVAKDRLDMQIPLKFKGKEDVDYRAALKAAEEAQKSTTLQR